MQPSNIFEEWKVIPEILIPFEVWQKIMAYTMNCPDEINGFGVVSFTRGVISVDDVFIVDQVVSAGGAETDHDAYVQYATEMLQRGEDIGRIKFQWHSHQDMAAYFSSIDEANIEQWKGDWLLSLVVNRRGDFCCRFDSLRPIRYGFEVQPRLVAPLPQELTTSIAAEVARKVKRIGWSWLGRERKEPVIDGSTQFEGVIAAAADAFSHI